MKEANNNIKKYGNEWGDKNKVSTEICKGNRVKMPLSGRGKPKVQENSQIVSKKSNLTNVNFAAMLAIRKMVYKNLMQEEIHRGCEKIFAKETKLAEQILKIDDRFGIGIKAKLEPIVKWRKNERKLLIERCKANNEVLDTDSQQKIVDKYGEENILDRLQELKDKKRPTLFDKANIEALTEICKSCYLIPRCDRNKQRDVHEKKRIEPERE